jgi:hypothetical protein
MNIDPDKVAENPGLLPYAHHVGSAIIKPLDKGKTKGLAMSAMYEQTGVQLNQLKQQIEVLISQAQTIHDRISVSESIYTAEVGFKANISQICFLYERANGKRVLSLVSPEEWGTKPPYRFVAKVSLLSDHTWDVLEMADEVEINAKEQSEA